MFYQHLTVIFVFSYYYVVVMSLFIITINFFTFSISSREEYFTVF